jgi:hypothetical protein
LLSAAKRRRRDSVATHQQAFTDQESPVEAVVRWSIRGDGPTHREGLSLSNDEYSELAEGASTSGRSSFTTV